MLLKLTLPRTNELVAAATIAAVHAGEGTSLRMGAKLLDFSVDLSSAVPHDCPPISLYRIALREPVWLRRLLVAPKDTVEAGANLAIFSTAQDEPLDREPARELRISIAGILDQSSWGDGGRS